MTVVVTSPKELFHYTTAQGLLGILESNSLRATDALYMNDASERQHGKELLHIVMTNEAKHSRSSVFKKYCEATELFVNQFPPFGAYVFCLTTHRNQLSQWRAYAANGGYSIGFHVDKLRTLLREKHLGGDLFKAEGLYKVIYHSNIQTELLKKAIQESFVMYMNEEVTKRSKITLHRLTCVIEGRDENHELEDFLNHISDFYIKTQQHFSTFKHPAYEEESEWRIVRSRSPLLGSKPVPLGFRPSADFLIPYCFIAPKGKDRLPISSITIGPREHPGLSVSAVEEALKAFGYARPAVAVFDSQIPLRQTKIFT